MLIVFKSEQSGDFVMLGDVATPLLNMMGMSGKPEGAVSAQSLQEARRKLETALGKQAVPAQTDTAAEAADEDEQEPAIGLATRAVPLLEMLRKAEAADGYVMWQPE